MPTLVLFSSGTVDDQLCLLKSPLAEVGETGDRDRDLAEAEDGETGLSGETDRDTALLCDNDLVSMGEMMGGDEPEDGLEGPPSNGLLGRTDGGDLGFDAEVVVATLLIKIFESIGILKSSVGADSAVSCKSIASWPRFTGLGVDTPNSEFNALRVCFSSRVSSKSFTKSNANRPVLSSMNLVARSLFIPKGKFSFCIVSNIRALSNARIELSDPFLFIDSVKLARRSNEAILQTPLSCSV